MAIEPIGDDRGFFARIWDESWSHDLGVEVRNVQTNLSANRHRGTIRGLHWQEAPYGESKLLRCTRGAVFDVAVDLRPESPTFGQWQGHIIDAESRLMVFVPEGCAHGYQALEDGAEVSYQVSHVYVPGSERGIRWNDPAIGIKWPITDGVIVSPKDSAWPDFDAETRA
jgi:dTDP-4-dehydrorhamnose 3,5-epimerase